ncbi:hypothetical protein C4D60_Mb03t11000 [Musa balbisiana]|uniref:Uncharacterized protein n=1 Tax=Musa balbisiana TaxID=52838 RepID=A0A4V4H612_MUSBA|nr:hypothetical protein C4D60_Mb03t11000 [Musa balbisiana]
MTKLSMPWNIIQHAAGNIEHAICISQLRRCSDDEVKRASISSRADIMESPTYQNFCVFALISGQRAHLEVQNASNSMRSSRLSTIILSEESIPMYFKIIWNNFTDRLTRKQLKHILTEERSRIHHCHIHPRLRWQQNCAKIMPVKEILYMLREINTTILQDHRG